MTQVEALARYAARAAFADLSAQSRKQLPVCLGVQYLDADRGSKLEAD